MPLTTVDDLTEGTVGGAGVFDELMRATKAHLDEEFSKNRVKGADYAQVYLGSLQYVMQYATQFLLEKDKAYYESQLVMAQVKLAEQQAENAVLEGENLVQQGLNLAAERENMLSQKALIDQQVLNLQAEALNIPKQGEKLDNENLVLIAEECKLRGEFDLIAEQRLKTAGEKELLAQKKATEKAQTSGAGIDPDSYIGRQIALYEGQTEGFKRDAEQKAAKVMVDTWNVRRTTDEATIADGTNHLSDPDIGRVITRLMSGVGA